MSEPGAGVTAVAYLRTSSASNVAKDERKPDTADTRRAAVEEQHKDSADRQREAINGYAQRNGLKIVREFYDKAVSGADYIDARPGFSELMAYMLGNGASVILVENASRFARDLIVQETGYAMLKKSGFTLVAVDDPDAFTADTPTAVMIRQILGAVSQFEKASLVGRLKGARDRASEKVGHRIDGRKGYTRGKEHHGLVTLVKSLRAKGLTFDAISAFLAEKGTLTNSGRPFSASQVKRIFEA
jgi:DNA invertase Pin-like site-specific DNA recombinase